MTEELSLETHILQPGAIIANRYEILKQIGLGGMGAIYLAVDLSNNREKVAVKVLHTEFGSSREYVERFIREMELMEKIHHPNIVETKDFGVDDNLIFFTMEFIDGRSLEHLMDEKLLDPNKIPDIIVGICRALRAIHSTNVIHRDLKPGNILISKDGDVKLTDFGVARPFVSEMTASHQKLGSVAYMAPEVWQGDEPTPAVDYYSLGIMLYEIITGDVPFNDENFIEAMEKHLNEDPVPPKELNPHVPDWLSTLTMKLLKKSPGKRLTDPDTIISSIKLYTGKNVDWKPITAARQARGLTRTKRRATMVLELTSTDSIRSSLETQRIAQRRRMTVAIPLPRNAAVILEIDKPSRDFLFLGVFLGSLQIFDYVLTSIGVERFGVVMEGNTLLRTLMHYFGPEDALFAVKCLAIIAVTLITIVAKRITWIKDMIAFLSVVYLFFAILPWLYFLYVRQSF